MTKILETPGFLLTKNTAKIQFESCPVEHINKCLAEARMFLAQNKFTLSKGYAPDGRSIYLSRSQRGTHQCHVGYDIIDLNRWLKPHIEKYAQENFFSDGLRIVKTQDFYLWYDPGFGISLHADDSTHGSADFHRVITVLIYLNDDYDGGEIHFPDHNILLKPKVGDTLIFPSNRKFVHEVKPILSGQRFAIMQTWSLVQ